MDCTNARLLLGFARTGELDPAERGVLEQHLSSCAECAAYASAEARFDDALELVMPRVAVPAGLKGRILERLAKAHPPRVWRWMAAAALVLAVGVGGALWFLSSPEELAFGPLVEKIDIKASPEAIEAAFSGWGVDMAAPREFNFDLLDAHDVAEVQGRRVAKLTFLAQGNGPAALAHVYVLPAAHFAVPLENGWAGDISIPASTHYIQIRRNASAPEFFFLVVYTSQSLDPFLLRGI